MSNESPFPYTVQGHPPAGTHGNELEQELESLITHPRYDLVESAEVGHSRAGLVQPLIRVISYTVSSSLPQQVLITTTCLS